jgi:hypothetical protein
MKTVDSLGALYLDARDGVRRLGKAGGGLLILCALLSAGGGASLWLLAAAREARRVNWHTIDLRVLGSLLAVVAVLLLVAGVRQVAHPIPPRGAERPPIAAADLLTIARSSLRPFFVCVACQRLWSRTECAGRCPQCDSAADCLEVQSDEDLKMVEAALR